MKSPGRKSGTIISSEVEISTLNDTLQSRDRKLVPTSKDRLTEYLLKDGDVIHFRFNV